jgi:hypothetical protein
VLSLPSCTGSWIRSREQHRCPRSDRIELRVFAGHARLQTLRKERREPCDEPIERVVVKLSEELASETHDRPRFPLASSNTRCASALTSSQPAKGLSARFCFGATSGPDCLTATRLLGTVGASR